MGRFCSASRCIEVLLITVILIFSIANYYKIVYNFQEMEIKILNQKDYYPNHEHLESDLLIKQQRMAALLSADSVQRDILKHAVGHDNKDFYERLKPEAYCPLKVKIGGNKDGGKVACNPKAVKEDCTLISLGLNNQVEYDAEIYNITGRKCAVIAVDKDFQDSKTQNIFLAMSGKLYYGKIPDNLTISYLMEQQYKKEVEILKMDIEGGEHTGLEPFLQKYYVCQILVEIHGWPPEHLDMLQKISRYGFRIYNIAPNAECPKCAEYSFINELCMTQFGVSPLANFIPRNLSVT